MTRPNGLGRLSEEQWARLQEILDRFEQAWGSAGEMSPDLGAFLPPVNEALRPSVLHELIKTDLEFRTRKGERVRLDRYLRLFPELGPSYALPPALIFEEYHARRRFGDNPPLEEYRRRFPAQYEDLQHLAANCPAPAPPARFPPAPPAPPPLVTGAAPSTLLPEPPPPAPELPTSAPPSPTVPLVAQTGLVFHAVGNYRFVKRLARGASGEVWVGEAPGGVEVALKVVFGSIARGEARRELDGLAVFKRLRHTFLLPTHAFWQQEDRLIIAMELADGCLAQRAEEARRTKTPIPGVELVGYIREAAEALDYLHAQRVLHRDVKPSNILLLQGHAKVADFGLAILVEQTRRLNTASDSGTPAYTAPEIFWRRRISASSDQYSLAATYAELRLGRPLFPSRNWLSLMQDHLQRSPDLLPLLEAEQQVLRRALAKEPEERFSSCLEFVRNLERVVPR